MHTFIMRSHGRDNKSTGCCVGCVNVVANMGNAVLYAFGTLSCLQCAGNIIQKEKLEVLAIEFRGAVSHILPLIFTWFFLKQAAEDGSDVVFKIM